MAAVVLTLGGIEFRDFEIPEAIGFGGRQMLSSKRLVGGRKVVDAMGPDEAPLEWEGRFRGADALARARAVDAIRRAGRKVACTWGENAYTVLVSSFLPFDRGNGEIPYSISCEVLSDDSAPLTTDIGIDQMVGADLSGAQTLGSRINDAGLTSLLGSLDSAIGRVSSFASSSSDVLASILAPISAVQSRVQLLTASAEITLQNVTTLGGVLPSNPVSRMGAGLLGQASAMTQASDLYELGAIMGRMATNVGAVGASGSVTIVAGGDLFRLAEQAYGDATEWSTIARANAISDPMIDGVQAILIPPTASGAGGVLAELRQTDVQATLRALTQLVGSESGVLDFSDPNNSGLVPLF